MKDWLLEHFSTGEKLPSENAIARQLSVARGTVRTVLERMREEGLIESRQGQGWFVARPARSLMAQTVVILSHLDREPRPGRGGWMEAVEAGAAEEARRSGKDVLFLHPERLTDESISQLLSDRPLGVLISHAVADTELGRSLVNRLAARGASVVVNSDAPGFEGFDRVVFDHRGGAFALVRFLVQRGRRRILRVWSAPPETYWLRERDAGYEDACREHGIEALKAVRVPDLTPPGMSLEAAIELRARHIAGFLVEHMAGPAAPDALMVTTDPEVLPAARACRLFGKRVHEDVEIVGYDNVWSEMPHTEMEPAGPSATIDKNNREAGRAMTRLLLDRLTGQLPEGPQRVLIGYKLITLSSRRQDP